MNTYHEERAEAMRLALRHNGPMSTREVAEKVIRWAGPLLSVRKCKHGTYLVDRRVAVVLVQEGLTPWERVMRICHEVGHHFSDIDLSDLYGQMTERERLLCPTISRPPADYEEHYADQMALAMKLPVWWVRWVGDPHEISARSGIPLKLVGKRLRTLGSSTFTFSDVPAWSAANSLQPAIHCGPERSILVTHTRTGCTYRFPLARRNHIAADLLALRDTEFAIKYAAFSAAPPTGPFRSRPIRVCIETVRTWASIEKQ